MRIRKRIGTALAILAALTLPLFGGSAGAVEENVEPFAVACESTAHYVDVNFAAGTATGHGGYSVCLSPTHPTIVRAEVLQFQGEVVGNPADVTIHIPRYRVRWLDAQADVVLITEQDLTLRYTGPLPNVMVAQIVALDGGVSLAACTASRTCPNGHTCDYVSYGVSLKVVLD